MLLIGFDGGPPPPFQNDPEVGFVVLCLAADAQSGTGWIWSGTEWLRCTGGTLPKEQYPHLCAVLGEIFGPATDTEFTLPDIDDVTHYP